MTKNYNTENELIKHKFLEMLENAKGRDIKTVNSYANAIHEFEVYTGMQDFKTYNIQQAIGFKEYLSSKKNNKTGDNIYKSYLQHYTSQVKEFFEWLTRQKGYIKHIKYDEVQYFTLSQNDRNRAKATNFQESYTTEKIIDTIRKMPSSTEIEMRNKAMISLCLLTTLRISVLQTARLGSIIKVQQAWAFVQNPNLVKTRFAKHINTYFMGNLQDICNNVIDCTEYFKKQGFTDKSPLFPKITPSFNRDDLQVFNLEDEL